MTELPVFSRIKGQPRVRKFLSAAVEGKRVSQGFLFVGPVGSGKVTAAYALAQALICPDGGCGECDHCIRMKRRTHPDVQFIEPEGASGYLAQQIRDVVEDVDMRPLRADRKIYILDRIEHLNGVPANALLKTLEEPPADATFILLATSQDVVLETIVSRCQVVPFRSIPRSEAVAILMEETGKQEAMCSAALAATEGSLERARSFVLSPTRLDMRSETLRILDGVICGDELDVLDHAKALVTAAKSPLSDVRSVQEALLEKNEEFLTRGALKDLEKRQKRELTASERAGMMEVLAIIKSWLRDCLSHTVGNTELVVNEDARESIKRSARGSTVGGITHAISSVDRARNAIERNVSPQLALEVMLFDIREDFTCPMSYR